MRILLGSGFGVAPPGRTFTLLCGDLERAIANEGIEPWRALAFVDVRLRCGVEFPDGAMATELDEEVEPFEAWPRAWPCPKDVERTEETEEDVLLRPGVCARLEWGRRYGEDGVSGEGECEWEVPREETRRAMVLLVWTARAGRDGRDFVEAGVLVVEEGTMTASGTKLTPERRFIGGVVKMEGGPMLPLGCCCGFGRSEVLSMPGGSGGAFSDFGELFLNHCLIDVSGCM